MNKKEQKNLIKQLTEKIKNATYEDITVRTNPLHRRKQVLDKYVSVDDYKQLVGLYKFLKSYSEVDFVALEKVIETNKKFGFLKKCQESIYQFVLTLKCYGPQYVAQEMTRQGKEIDYINHYLKED